MSGPVVAVCGKGGVGKTVVSALLGRVLLDSGVEPVLLVDADPVGGLAGAVGSAPEKTLGGVLDESVAALRRGEAGPREVSSQLDYLLLEALSERGSHAVLAIGRPSERGCFCPVHALLRAALERLSGPFAATVVDAEAGLEQISREVTRSVSRVLVVVDGSRRAREALGQIAAMVPGTPVSAVANRCRGGPPRLELPPGVELAGWLPEDDQVRALDEAGRSLWQLEPASPVWAAAERVARCLGLVPAAP